MARLSRFSRHGRLFWGRASGLDGSLIDGRLAFGLKSPTLPTKIAKAMARRAMELGINYFDTARIYWNGCSEEVYGAVLPPSHRLIFLTSKSPQRTHEGANTDLDNSLRAAKTDYLDLGQIHQVSTLDKVEQIFAPGGAIEAFEAAR